MHHTREIHDKGKLERVAAVIPIQEDAEVNNGICR